MVKSKVSILLGSAFGLWLGLIGAGAESLSSSPVPAKIKPVAPPKAATFPLSDVRLLVSPFKAGQDIGVKYLLDLEPDRFLANFRKEAGLEPKAKQYGGWESQGVSGHTGGHYLSGCAIAYAATGESRLLERVNYFVKELAVCQAANGNGYVAAIPNGMKTYEEVASGKIKSSGFDLNGIWVPNYTLHKLLAGLRDAYRLCGNNQALEISRKLGDWFEKTLSGLNENQMQAVLAAEHGGMNEVLADLYADTGDVRYLTLSRRFHHRAILDPLSHGEDILPGKHGNTQIPKLIGLATRYELAGMESDRETASFFWDRVVNHHSYVTGGHSDHEHFGPADKLNDRLSTMTTESCNVYNMLKLTRHVFGWNPNAAVADFYERALLNHIRATQHPDGRVIYYLSLHPGHFKEYQSLDDGFTCCVGTGMENHVKYGEAIYFHNAQDIWVNLFIPSDLNWPERGLKLRQETGWPNSDSSHITLNLQKSSEFTVLIRHPYWATKGFSVRVNGRLEKTTSAPSSYVSLKRKWKKGDHIDVEFPMGLRTEAMPDNPNRIAFFNGPTLLAAELGGIDDLGADLPFYVPAIVSSDADVTHMLQPVPGEPGSFASSRMGHPQDFKLVPFHALQDHRYTVYIDKYTPAEWSQRETEIRTRQEEELALAARTIDNLRIGEMQPERDHDLQGEKTAAGEAFGRKWRHATDGGWFSFKLKVDADKPSDVQLTFWGEDGGKRTFDILADNVKLTTVTLQNNKPGQFFDVVLPIPENLTKGRESVVVKLQAHPDNMAGGIFGARSVRH